MLPVLNVGSLAIQTPGLILLIGLWLAMSAAEKFAHRFGIRPSDVNVLLLTSLISGLIGARLGFFARQPSIFLASPLSLLSPNPLLFDMQAGLLFTGIAIFVAAQRRKLPLAGLLDTLTPAAAVFAVALALSRVASGDGFGEPANLPWSIELWGERRHPTQIYETIVALLILVVIWRLARNHQDSWRSQPGRLLVLFTALSASVRLFLEAYRGDSVLLLDRYRSAQVIAWVVLAASLAYLYLVSVKQTADLPLPQPTEAPDAKSS